MEFVKVTYVTDRRVNIDGQEGGRTNEVLRVDEGTHAFDLGKPADYEPATRRILVTETTVLQPLIVAFTRKLVQKKAPRRKKAATGQEG